MILMGKRRWCGSRWKKCLPHLFIAKKEFFSAHAHSLFILILIYKIYASPAWWYFAACYIDKFLDGQQTRRNVYLNVGLFHYIFERIHFSCRPLHSPSLRFFSHFLGAFIEEEINIYYIWDGFASSMSAAYYCFRHTPCRLPLDE